MVLVVEGKWTLRQTGFRKADCLGNRVEFELWVTG